MAGHSCFTDTYVLSLSQCLRVGGVRSFPPMGLWMRYAGFGAEMELCCVLPAHQPSSAERRQLVVLWWSWVGTCSKEEKVNVPIYSHSGKRTICFSFRILWIIKNQNKQTKNPNIKIPTWLTAQVKVIYIGILQKELTWVNIYSFNIYSVHYCFLSY